MKKIFCLLFLFVFVSPVFASTYVNGYMRKNGTYVSGHYRSTADSVKYNNYSTQGNYNPYTGKQGYKNPYNSYSNSYRKYSSGYKIKNW